MRVLGFILTLFALTKSDDMFLESDINFTPQCIQFSVGSGTGCAWMCNYCANQLDTNNYYFVDNVCTYQTGQGCVGNPVAGKLYTCCVA